MTRYKGGSVTSGGVPLGTVEPCRGCSGVTWPMMPEGRVLYQVTPLL